MKNLLKFTFLVLVSLTLTNCQTCTECTSSLTGWKFNNPEYGNYIKGKSFEGSKPPGGMVAIEGGTPPAGPGGRSCRNRDEQTLCHVRHRCSEDDHRAKSAAGTRPVGDHPARDEEASRRGCRHHRHSR